MKRVNEIYNKCEMSYNAVNVHLLQFLLLLYSEDNSCAILYIQEVPQDMNL